MIKNLKKWKGSNQMSLIKHLFQGWILPLILLVLGSYLIYLVLSLFSAGFSFKATFFTDSHNIYNSISNFIELNVAILGIVLTVVAIVVQLAAQKYTPKLADLFLENHVNRLFFFFMVFNLLFTIFITYSIKNQFVPIYAAFFAVFSTSIQIGLLLPYFSYVFNFLSPENIMAGIQKKSVKIFRQVHKKSKQTYIEKKQNEMVNVIEQLSDTALNSTSQEDRNMSLISVNRLRDLLINYQSIKSELPPSWFVVPADFFINISEEFYNEILEKKIWLDSMIFMNMEGIFKTSFRTMADTTSAITYNTRKIGVASIINKQEESIHLTIEYFNTFLRLALNEKNQRVIFNLFYQYRLVAEALFDNHKEDLAERIIFYFKYYGKIAYDSGIWFILMISAYDIGFLLKKPFERKVKNFEKLLEMFLNFDDVFSNQSHPIAKAGVRKAQLILAAYLFSHKADTNLIQKIVQVFEEQETYHSITGLKNQLLGVKNKKFWEVTDRGINFEYMNEEQKKALQKFFEKYISVNKENFRQKNKKKL